MKRPGFKSMQKGGKNRQKAVVQAFVGYGMAILGLIVLLWNAFSYLSGDNKLIAPAGVGIVLVALGAILIQKGRKNGI